MRKDNDSKKRILASLVMGLNCVNSFAPMVGAVNMEQPIKVDTKPVKETVAEPEQYTAACYQALDVVDSAIFGTAEAAFTENVGTAFATSSVNGETVERSGVVSVQNISAGGIANNGIVSSGGTQAVFTGGIGNIANISNAQQIIYAGGIGNIDTFVSEAFASQVIFSGGSGSVRNISDWGGSQIISSGGTGTIDSAGIQANQRILSGGSGHIENLYASGSQSISSGGTGSIDNNVGTQTIYTYGCGTIDVNSGRQYVRSTGKGSITTQVAGFQSIDHFGNGTIDVMSGGWQSATSSATAIINIMRGGTQTGAYARFTINTMSDGLQVVSGAGCTGTISTMIGGTQQIMAWLSGYHGTGTVVDMQDGLQIISSGGSAINTNVSGGEQRVLASANVSNTVVTGSGVQNLNGMPNSLINNVIQSGGVQNVSTGVTITNQDIGAGGTQNVLAGGSADVTSTVIMGGTQNVSGNVTISAGANQIVSGLTSVATGGSLLVQGTQTVTTGGTAQGTEVATGGSQIVTGGTAIASLLQTGAEQIISAGLVTGQEVPTGATQQLFGGTVDGDNITGGTVEFYNPSAAFNDVTMTDGLIRFGADGGTYNILGTFDFQDGTVDMVSNPDGHTPNPGTYETLNIANLQGNGGTFKLDIDLNSAVYGSENTYGDKIVINNGTPGTHYIQVVDKSLYTGTEITGDRKLLLVTDLSGVNNLTYVGKDLNNGGVWHTLPPQLFKEGNKWYLGYIQKEASNDTTTYLTDRQVAVYNQWTRIANDSLRKRLGDLRYNDAEAGVWARYYRGKLSGDNFDQSYNTYQVGIDKTSGQSTFGLAVEKQEASQSYGYGNGDGTTVAGNIYYTKYTDTGSYFDAILKYGKINSKYDTTGNFPDHADYDTKAYSLSLEYGKTNTYKNGFFVEPKVQLTYGHISAENYTTNRGTLVEESAIKSLIGKIGFVAGRKISDNSDYYFKAGLFHEFKGDRDVHLAAANGENMYKSENYGDSWFEIGLGGNVKLAKNTHLYGDVEKSIGADIQKDWQFNVGVRWEF